MKAVWNADKAEINERKHGVTFDEALTVFADRRALLIEDPDHSDIEDKFLIFGTSLRLRVLAVSHCYRETTDVVRIISARKATTSERAQYEARK